MAHKKKMVPELRFPEFDGEWESKKLGDVAKIITGSTPNTSITEYYDGDYLFATPGDLNYGRFVNSTKSTLTNSGFSKGRKIKSGSVLFVSIGSTIGKVGQAGRDLITNQQINCLESNNENYNDFLYSLLEKVGNRIRLLAGVQAVPQLNKTDFSNLIYHFPTLPEQQKIADFLSAVDQRIQLLQKKKEHLETYKKGVMQQIFSQKIRFKDENGENYPNWEEKKLGEVVQLFSGGTPTSTNSSYYNGSIPFIKSGEISNALTEQSLTQEGLSNSSAKMVEIGDLLMAIYGATSGEVAISKLNGAINQAVLCIRGKFNKLYLYHWLKYYKNIITQSYLQGGQGNLSASIIKELKISLPTHSEQQKIAEFLSSIDASIDHLTSQIEYTQTFKKGLLQKMFV